MHHGQNALCLESRPLHGGRGLKQDDGGPATRRGNNADGSAATNLMSWALASKVMARFPKQQGNAALTNHTITSMGIEFDLPGKADGKAGK